MDLCVGMHGTRSVQKLIEVVSRRPLGHRKLLARFLRENVATLSHEINGNHVLVKVLQNWSHQDKDFIYQELVKKTVEIACHKHGCCLMQKSIDAANQEQKEVLTMAIAKQTRRFVRDPFANYVIQYVLGLKMKHISKEVGSQLLGSLLDLSLEKFSSNVIEKCLEATTEEIRNKMVAEIASAPTF